jgi:hypothetical protein
LFAIDPGDQWRNNLKNRDRLNCQEGVGLCGPQSTTSTFADKNEAVISFGSAALHLVGEHIAKSEISAVLRERILTIRCTIYDFLCTPLQVTKRQPDNIQIFNNMSNGISQFNTKVNINLL